MRNRALLAKSLTVLFGSLAVLSGALVSAQQPGGAPPQPVFRSDVNYVELPVRVLDRKGEIVRDLGESDFKVFEDGTLQVVSTFRFIDLPLPDPRKPLVESANAPAKPFVLNDTDEIKGRIYLFVIDDYHLLQQNTFQLKRLVQDFIRKRMGPDDIAAIIFASVTHGQDFTQDRRALLSAVDRTMGSFDGQDTSGTQALRTVSTVQKLGSMIQQLGRIRNRHKALLYISPTLGCSVTRVPQMAGLSGGDPRTSRTAIGPSVTERPGMRCFDMLQDVVRAAVRANVSVYSLDPTGVQNPSWVSPTIDGRGGPGAAMEKMQMASGTISTGLFDGLRVLADETGGFAAVNINGFNKAFDRIVRENSAYYLIGYYSTNARNDGSERKNVITLSRPGVDLVYRPSYTATRN